MAKRDYYKTLGVSKNASQQEIKSAYRKLARNHHPDVDHTNGASERFKEINEAYQVLSDPEKKAAYDQIGHAAFEPGAGRGFGYQAWPGFDFDFTGFRNPFDIFEEFFGFRSPFGETGRQRRGPKSGEDLAFEVVLDFEEAVKGAEKEISYQRLASCSECGGSGAKKGTLSKTCPSCQGTGQVRRSTSSIFGSFATITTCSHCEGRGEVLETPCSRCGGNGRVKVTEKLKIKVPAGVDSGSQLRFAGNGNAGERGSSTGDLYLHFRVKPHKFFHREEDNIFLDVPITFTQAALGDVIEVPTIQGKVQLKIPAGTQSGTQFRLANRGVPHLRSSGQGDQYVTVEVQTPRKLTKAERELFEKLKDHEKSPKSILDSIFG